MARRAVQRPTTKTIGHPNRGDGGATISTAILPIASFNGLGELVLAIILTSRFPGRAFALVLISTSASSAVGARVVSLLFRSVPSTASRTVIGPGVGKK